MWKKQSEKVRLRSAVNESLAEPSAALVPGADKYSVSNSRIAKVYIPTDVSVKSSFSWRIFAGFLICVAFLIGPWAEIGHLWLLSNVTRVNADSQLQTRVAYATALSPLMPAAADAEFKELIHTSENAYGAGDIRAAYVKLCYASALLRAGSADGAVVFSKPALELARASKAKIALFPFTRLFQSLADDFAAKGKHDDAVAMYKAAIDAWDANPGKGTKTNCEADLALTLEDKKDFAGAAHYMQMAYDVTRNWGSGHEQYSIFRAYKLSYYYRHAGDFSKAMFYAKDALHMVQEARGSIYSEDAEAQLKYSQFALKNHTLDPSD